VNIFLFLKLGSNPYRFNNVTCDSQNTLQIRVTLYHTKAEKYFKSSCLKNEKPQKVGGIEVVVGLKSTHNVPCMYYLNGL